MDDLFRIENGAAFFRHYPIKGANASTFEALGDIRARDDRAIYCQNTRLRAADRATFRVLNSIYAKDAARAYALSGEIKGADVDRFEAFGTGEWDDRWGPREFFRQGYAADARTVWHYVLTIGKPSELRGVDRASFRVLTLGFARDAHHAYYESVRVPTRPASSRWGGGWSRDARQVYFHDRPVDVDLPSFRFVSPDEVRDRLGRLRLGQRIPD